MSLLSPWALLAGLTIPAIVALWMLKLRRRRVVVPSTLLWQRAIVDQAANAPFQRLRANLLLVLQILAAAVLAFALARPVIQATPTDRNAVLFLVDQSASMSATDEAGGKSRLAVALEAVGRELDSLQSGQQAAIVAFANRATVLQPFTTDRSALREAVTSIKPTDLPTVADEALALAGSLAAPLGARIHVISDGAFDARNIRLREDQVVEFTRVGTSGANVGITAADLRRPADRATTETWQVFLNLQNFGSQPVDGTLEVRANGQLVDVRAVTLPATESVPQIFLQSGIQSPEVEFRLITNDDPLEADNSVFVVLQPPRSRKVLLVSSGNYFLERALRIAPRFQLDVERVTPSQWSDRLAESADLVIFDGACPAQRLPAGSYLFLQCIPPVDGFTRTGTLEQPAILDWDQAHPLMRYVELDDVAIRRAGAFALPASAQTVVEAEGGPLIAAWSANNIHAVIWAFDVYETNFPLRMAFPILTANCVEWLLRRGRQSEALVGQTGTPLTIELPADTTRATLTDPEGRNWELGTEEVRVSRFDRTNRVGFYRTLINSEPGPVFGVSLLSEDESRIAPAAALVTEGRSAVAASANEARLANREIWRWGVVVLLFLVVLEWLVYHRRVLMQ